MAKRLKTTFFVCPYLLDFEPSELTGPLAQFQAAVASKQDTLELLRDVDNAMEKQLSEDQLVETFEEWWPKLEADLANIPGPHEEKMVKMAKEFKAYEIVEGKEIDLPLLPEPVYTYTDAERNIDYGTVFAFALGWNPEVLITFEKYPKGISCELVRIGGAEEMHVLWKGQEIWKSDLGGEKAPEVSRSYINFWYDDLEEGKLKEYMQNLGEISIGPQTILLDAEPSHIDRIEDKLVIKPDFLDWEAFSMLFWVQITQDFINTKENRYLFLYTTDPKDKAKKEESYPNGLYFGMRFSQWELAIKGPDPQHEMLITFPKSEVGDGWNMFLVRCDKASSKIGLDIVNIDPEKKFEPREGTIEPDGWPQNVHRHFFELGGWADIYPRGISSLKFYRFRLYEGMLSDDEVGHIFRTERNLVQGF